MFSLFLWYLTVSLLGLIAFPLAHRLLPALADRGYSLSRALGLLIWGYVFWMSASLGIAQNDAGGLIFALTALIALSVWAGWNQRGEILDWLKTNRRFVITTEALFLIAFLAMAFVRASNPETTGTEKPMELAFINAILHSPTFPPHDPWLSGYSISYYYFGYVLTAMLAKFTATPGAVAFNLMLSLLFALNAIGAYGILFTLLSKFNKSQFTNLPIYRSLLAPLFLLVVSNVEGFLEILHRRGLGWTFNADGTVTSSFWSRLDMKELSLPPTQPLGWMPDRFWWWWRASRVVQDYDFEVWREIIDEFPFFSYLLGDLHPHVLAMPFALLVVGLALNLFLGGWRGETNLFGLKVALRAEGLLVLSVALGGLAFLNTWDFPIYLAVVCGAFILARAHAYGWNWARFEEFLKFGFPLGVASIVLYLPFYLGFQSQAGGILPNLINPTRGAHLWVMFGTLLLPIFAWFLYLIYAEKHPVDWGAGFSLAFAVMLILLTLALTTGLIVINTDMGKQYLADQGVTNASNYLIEVGLRRLSYIFGLSTQLLVLGGALSFLVKSSNQPAAIVEGKSANNPVLPSARVPSGQVFVFLLIVIGGLLVLTPDFVYLRDQFGNRMNTIFKFYYQAWLLWSLAASFGLAVLLDKLRGLWAVIFRVGFAFLLIVGLTYPVLSLPSKTNNFNPSSGWTLNGADNFARYAPDDAAAAMWLSSAPIGTLVEAVGGQYSEFARIATYSGQPGLLGWPGHEAQWRGGYAEMGTREQDIERLYQTNSWDEAQLIIDQYGIRYIYVGSLERSKYGVSESKFQQHLEIVFQQGEATLYRVP
jgi:YYY domain-containing protein